MRLKSRRAVQRSSKACGFVRAGGSPAFGATLWRLVIGLLLTTTGCATGVYQNKPISNVTPGNYAALGHGGYRLNALERHSSPELLMMLTFSGGGKRSSALSYGVLRGLRDIPIRIDGQGHRLLDEVDGIEAVSGGSFTAAYYGLYRGQTVKKF